MVNWFEGIVTPLFFIGFVLAGAILGIIASIEIENIETNAAIVLDEQLTKANRDLIIGYLLYFLALLLVIISLITHAVWKTSPPWLQMVLVSLAFLSVVIGLVFNWYAARDLDNLELSQDIHVRAYWAFWLGIAGAVFGVLLIFFRITEYTREHSFVKQGTENLENKEGLQQNKQQNELGTSMSSTTQIKSPNYIRTSTTQKHYI